MARVCDNDFQRGELIQVRISVLDPLQGEDATDSELDYCTTCYAALIAQDWPTLTQRAASINPPKQTRRGRPPKASTKTEESTSGSSAVTTPSPADNGSTTKSTRRRGTKSGDVGPKVREENAAAWELAVTGSTEE